MSVVRKTLFAVAATLGMGHAHAALMTGDLAFTAFNADEDGWAIVALKSIDPNTTIFFRDDEWNGSAFNAGEGLRTWSTGAGAIAAGTVIRFSAVDKVSAAVSIGSLTQAGDIGINATDETIYAYLGTDVNTPTTFLSALTTKGTDADIATTGLTVGTNAVSLTASTDFAEYTGARAGLISFAAYAALVNNPANWDIRVGGAQEAVIPNTTNFSVVPVPAALPLLLSGLGLLGFSRRLRA